MKHTARRENKEERRESDGSSLSREHWQASIHGTHDHWYWFVSPLQISEMYFYPKGRHTVESINGGEAGAWTIANQGNKEEQWGGWWKHGRNYEDISARKRIALSIHPILREVQWLKWSFPRATEQGCNQGPKQPLCSLQHSYLSPPSPPLIIPSTYFPLFSPPPPLLHFLVTAGSRHLAPHTAKISTEGQD